MEKGERRKGLREAEYGPVCWVNSSEVVSPREPGNLGTVLETSLEPSIAGPVSGFLCSAITSISPTWSMPYLFACPYLRSQDVLFISL